MTFRNPMRGFVLVTLLTLAASGARAQAIEFKGSTAGCFFTTASCTPTGNAQVMFLDYFSSSFDTYSTSTNPGVAALGTGSMPQSTLGFFELGRTPDVYYGQNFLLKVAFQSPFLTNPNAVYTASVIGMVSPSNAISGGVQIFFGPPQTFTFNGPQYQGNFTLIVNSVAVSPGTLESHTPVPVTAFIVDNVIASPEPATLGLLATGGIGLIPLGRLIRRKRV